MKILSHKLTKIDYFKKSTIDKTERYMLQGGKINNESYLNQIVNKLGKNSVDSNLIHLIRLVELVNESNRI